MSPFSVGFFVQYPDGDVRQTTEHTCVLNRAGLHCSLSMEIGYPFWVKHDPRIPEGGWMIIEATEPSEWALSQKQPNYDYAG